MVKGIVMTVATDFIEKEFGPDAKEAWLNTLTEDERRAFEYPLATSWYPTDLYWKGGMAACQMLAPENLAETARKWGAHSARTQLTGIYRLLLKLGTPNMMLSSAPKMWKTFNDEGAISVPSNEKGRGVMRIDKLSLKDPLFGELVAGWIEEAIRLSGKDDVKVLVTMTPRDATNDSYEFTLSWTP